MNIYVLERDDFNKIYKYSDIYLDGKAFNEYDDAVSYLLDKGYIYYEKQDEYVKDGIEIEEYVKIKSITLV